MKYLVTIFEESRYEVEVEASSKEEVRQQVLSGEVDYQSDYIDGEVTYLEVEEQGNE